MVHPPVSQVELTKVSYCDFLVHQVPDHKTQKQELQAVLQQRLRKGDTWYECVGSGITRVYFYMAKVIK